MFVSQFRMVPGRKNKREYVAPFIRAMMILEGIEVEDESYGFSLQSVLEKALENPTGPDMRIPLPSWYIHKIEHNKALDEFIEHEGMTIVAHVKRCGHCDDGWVLHIHDRYNDPYEAPIFINNS